LTFPEDTSLIGVKQVFKIKFKNGECERRKARIVALGYQQRKNVDFFESFSPTTSYVTIRLVLTLTALPHWYGVDLDAKTRPALIRLGPGRSARLDSISTPLRSNLAYTGRGAFISASLPPEEQVYFKGIPNEI
jgi:hypothetical protein